MAPDGPNDEEEELPPYIIEHARSGRSKCKGCRRLIDKGVVRLGVLIEGPYGAGHIWFHLECAAKRELSRLEEAYASEAWTCAKVPLDEAELPTLDSLRGLGAKAEAEREKRAKNRKTLPYAEVAPSGRSKCKQSGEPIPLGAVRIVLGKEAQFGNQVRTSPFAVLPEHVAEALAGGEITTAAEELAAELRANSEMDAAALEQAIEAMGL